MRCTEQVLTVGLLTLALLSPAVTHAQTAPGRSLVIRSFDDINHVTVAMSGDGSRQKDRLFFASEFIDTNFPVNDPNEFHGLAYTHFNATDQSVACDKDLQSPNLLQGRGMYPTILAWDESPEVIVVGRVVFPIPLLGVEVHGFNVYYQPRGRGSCNTPPRVDISFRNDTFPNPPNTFTRPHLVRDGTNGFQDASYICFTHSDEDFANANPPEQNVGSRVFDSSMLDRATVKRIATRAPVRVGQRTDRSEEDHCMMAFKERSGDNARYTVYHLEQPRNDHGIFIHIDSWNPFSGFARGRTFELPDSSADFPSIWIEELPNGDDARFLVAASSINGAEEALVWTCTGDAGDCDRTNDFTRSSLRTSVRQSNSFRDPKVFSVQEFGFSPFVAPRIHDFMVYQRERGQGDAVLLAKRCNGGSWVEVGALPPPSTTSRYNGADQYLGTPPRSIAAASHPQVFVDGTRFWVAYLAQNRSTDLHDVLVYESNVGQHCGLVTPQPISFP